LIIVCFHRVRERFFEGIVQEQKFLFGFDIVEFYGLNVCGVVRIGVVLLISILSLMLLLL